MILRVATYNLHECVGTDGTRSPERVLDVLRRLDADLLLLQEISNRYHPEGGGRMIDWFARALGMHAIVGQTLVRGDAAYGNACLSRPEPATVRLHDLSVPGREPRGLIELRYGARQAGLRVLATHLGLRRRERRRQYQYIARTLGTEPAPVTLLGGDFNDLGLPRFFRQALPGLDSAGRAPSFPSRRPILALDRLYAWPGGALRGVAAVKTATSRVASDHLPVIGEIDLGETAESDLRI